MKMIAMILGLVLLVVCPVSGRQQHRDSTLALLTKTITEFYGAIERGDAMARVQLLDEDAILMPNGWHMVRGKENAAAVFTADTTDFIFRIKDRAIIELTVADSIAYTINSYEYTYHRKGTPPQWRKTKNVHIWQLHRDGSWKLHADIWNSDLPIEFKTH